LIGCRRLTGASRAIPCSHLTRTTCVTPVPYVPHGGRQVHPRWRAGAAWAAVRACQRMPRRAAAMGTRARHSVHTATYPERPALDSSTTVHRSAPCATALARQRGPSCSRSARALTVDERAEVMARLSESRGAGASWAPAHAPSRVRRPRTGPSLQRFDSRTVSKVISRAGVRSYTQKAHLVF